MDGSASSDAAATTNRLTGISRFFFFGCCRRRCCCCCGPPQSLSPSLLLLAGPSRQRVTLDSLVETKIRFCYVPLFLLLQEKYIWVDVVGTAASAIVSRLLTGTQPVPHCTSQGGRTRRFPMNLQHQVGLVSALLRRLKHWDGLRGEERKEEM